MRNIFLVLLSACLGSCIEDGDVSSDSVNQWTFVKASDGLPNNLITTLYTDSDGNVWIGTTNGLSKYNGTSFKNYSTTNGPLTNNWILSITENRNGYIFVGTKNGLNIFDGDDWIEVVIFDGIEATALAEASNGDLWVGTSGYGVVQLFSSGGYEQHFDNVCNNCNFVHSLFRDEDRDLWIGSEADVKVYDGSFESFTVSDGIAGPWISAINQDHWGNIWLGSAGDPAITQFNNSDFDQIPLVTSSSFNWVRAIVEDRNGLLWLAADEGGLLYYDGVVMRKRLDIFEDEYVTALTVDNNGVLWVGSEGAGIAKYLPHTN